MSAVKSRCQVRIRESSGRSKGDDAADDGREANIVEGTVDGYGVGGSAADPRGDVFGRVCTFAYACKVSST